MCIIGILATMAIFIKFIIDNHNSYSYISMTIIFIVITPRIIFLSIYLHFYIIPKLIVNRFKNDATKIYRNNEQFFSSEKIITIKDKCIEVDYNNKKLNIEIRRSIFVGEFKGYIIITDIFMKNKVRKIYPLVIPINIFESEEDKKNFMFVYILFISIIVTRFKN